MDEIPAIAEKAPFVHRYISGDLLHPGFIRVWCHSRDFNLAAIEMDKEQHIISDQPTQRQYEGQKLSNYLAALKGLNPESRKMSHLLL